jgi:hypothetical protein
MDAGELVLQAERRPLIWPLVGSLAFVVIGAWMVGTGSALGWVVIVFFGVGLVVFPLAMLPGSASLRIGRDGYVVRWMFRDRAESWEHIKIFVPSRLPSITPQWRVGFLYHEWYVPRGGRAGRGGLAASTSLSGLHGRLPNNFGLSAQELADLLNTRLTEYRSIHGL